jgi:hypothetical protein
MWRCVMPSYHILELLGTTGISIERKKLELAADLGVAPSSIHISIIDV